MATSPAGGKGKTMPLQHSGGKGMDVYERAPVLSPKTMYVVLALLVVIWWWIFKKKR
jgi:hypothetical protein